MNAWEVPGCTETRELGSGASGRVVLAVHEATGTEVAVKYLSEQFRADPAFVSAFREEARLLGGLDSPYVAGLYEYVEAPQGAAIVMELVDGVALRALLRQEGATVPEAALVVLKGSLLGLAAAHRAGVVHRDYKPENVLVKPDGSSKLVDFGIAVRSGTDSGGAGTPLYMAPEQWNGEPASPATDVYAATATFYECLTGRRPYSGQHVAELAVKHLTAPVPEEGVPEPVRPLIRHGMAKDPAQRPADAAAFVAELEEVAGAAYGEDWEERGQRKLAALAALLPLLLPSAGGGAAGATDLATTILSGAGRGRWLGRSGWLTGAGLVILAGVLTVTAVASGPGQRRTTAETAATTSAVPAGITAGPTAGPSGGPSASEGTSGSPAATESGSPTVTEGSTSSPSAGPDGETSGHTDGPTSAGTDTAGPGDPTTAPPTRGPSASTSEPGESEAPAKVSKLSVTDLRAINSKAATATIGVATSGTGPVTLKVSWYTALEKGTTGKPDGTPQTFELSGRTQYTVTANHAFTSRGCYWSVRASTDPAAPNGDAWQRTTNPGCIVQ